MPELPEVTTTAKKLNDILPQLKIIDVWTNYRSNYYVGKNQIKNPKYFLKFKKEVIGTKIESVNNIGKNILINISGPKTILIHMKMTGHLLYGLYIKNKNDWIAKEKGPLQDKINGHIRLVFELSNKKHLVLSDVRKFAKITLIPDSDIKNFIDTKNIGPNPLSSDFDFNLFKKIIRKKKRGRIKNILMDQELIAGIGNIYSDEALFLSGIHPLSNPHNIPNDEIKILLKNIKMVLKKGIDFGGDSMSDYRQPDGTKGNFQNHHNVYQKRGQKCSKKSCNGTIIRQIVGGRSSHFCNTHQKLF